MSLNLKVFTNIHFKKMLAQPYWHVNCFLQSSCVTIFSTSSASTWTLQILNKLFFLAISDLTKGQTCTIDYFSSECPTDKLRTLCFFFPREHTALFCYFLNLKNFLYKQFIHLCKRKFCIFCRQHNAFLFLNLSLS